MQASNLASASLGAAKRREKEALDRAQFLEDERAARESTLAELQASYQLSQSEARLGAAVNDAIILYKCRVTGCTSSLLTCSCTMQPRPAPPGQT